jgi:hypothetical protein
VVAHYQTYLTNRRPVRPTDDYKPVTDSEWAEFDEHFDKRKVELGSCARPLLARTRLHPLPDAAPGPAMLARLDQLETDLLHRQAEANARHWLGELEGRPTVTLGLPAVPDRTTSPQPDPRRDRQARADATLMAITSWSSPGTVPAFSAADSRRSGNGCEDRDARLHRRRPALRPGQV